MKNVGNVVVGMIKQSVLKQVKRGRELVKAKFYVGERGNIIIIVIIVLSYFSYVIFCNLIYLTLSNINIQDMTTINFKKDNFYSLETTLDKCYTVNVLQVNGLSYDGCKEAQERSYSDFLAKG